MRNIHEANYTCAAVNGIDNFIGTPENATTELLVQGNTNIIDVCTCQSVYGILIIGAKPHTSRVNDENLACVRTSFSPAGWNSFN